jgi:hypothetical protein
MEAHISPWSEEAAATFDAVEVTARRSRRSGAEPTLPGDRLRRGARTLRWAAALVALLAVVGQGLAIYAVGDDQGFDPYGSGLAQFGQYLSGISWPIGLAAIVLAASLLVTGYAGRLDLDRALAEGD